MRFPRKCMYVFCCLAFTAFLPGCGGGGGTEALPPMQSELKEIHEMYMHHIKSTEKPPAKLADLTKKEYEGSYPAGVKALQDGKFLVEMGVSAKDGSTLLAYEKNALTQGGAAIMANGTIKTVTADQLKSLKRTP